MNHGWHRQTGAPAHGSDRDWCFQKDIRRLTGPGGERGEMEEDGDEHHRDDQTTCSVTLYLLELAKALRIIYGITNPLSLSRESQASHESL